jgi:hypothetical protein
MIRWLVVGVCFVVFAAGSLGQMAGKGEKVEIEEGARKIVTAKVIATETE